MFRADQLSEITKAWKQDGNITLLACASKSLQSLSILPRTFVCARTRPPAFVMKLKVHHLHSTPHFQRDRLRCHSYYSAVKSQHESISRTLSSVFLQLTTRMTYGLRSLSVSICPICCISVYIEILGTEQFCKTVTPMTHRDICVSRKEITPMNKQGSD